MRRWPECKLPTEYGEFDLVTFRDTIDNQVHFALKKGSEADQPTLVRCTCTTC